MCAARPRLSRSNAKLSAGTVGQYCVAVLIYRSFIKIEDRIFDEVSLFFSHRRSDRSSRVVDIVLEPVERITIGSEASPRLNAKQIAEIQFSLALIDSQLIDQALSSRHYGSCRDQLDCHVRQTLEDELAVDDRATMPHYSALSRGLELRDMLLEIRFVLCKPWMQSSIERCTRTEPASNARSRVTAD